MKEINDETYKELINLLKEFTENGASYEDWEVSFYFCPFCDEVPPKHNKSCKLVNILTKLEKENVSKD